MDQRKQSILTAITKEYTKTALPVGSKILVEKYGFNLSPATLRAEMVELTKQKYLVQPYTSAGRVPTDKGYRYFIDSLMSQKALSLKEQKLLQKELLKLKDQQAQLLRVTAKLLASLSHNLVIGSFLEPEDFCEAGMQELLKEPEFNDLNQVSQMFEMLNWLDGNIGRLAEIAPERSVEVFIGQENPLVPIKDWSMVVSGYQLPSGRKALVAILGPKRMRYARNVSLVEYITKLFSGGLVLILFINL